MDTEDADDDGDDDGDYSDDEDMSWKIRRASAKILSSIIATRPDKLPDLYSSALPLLIVRFQEREESVRSTAILAAAWATGLYVPAAPPSFPHGRFDWT